MNEPANAPPGTYLTDYLRPVRRHKLLVGVVVAVFVVGSLAHSLSEPTRYSAQAVILFQDPAQAITLTGATGSDFLTAQQLSQIGADTIISPTLLSTLKQRLGTSLSTNALKQLLSTSSDPTTSQVTIQAQGSTGSMAARLANDAADLGAAQQAAAQRARYAADANRLQTQEDQLPHTPAGDNQRVEYANEISRLRTLSTLTQPVQVVSRATPPSSPSSPTPVKDGVIFGILGLVLGSIAAFAREAFDRRLRSGAEIEEELALPVLGSIGDDAMGKAGQSTSGLGALSEADSEAFRIMRTNLRFSNKEHPPRVILVTSPMPQEGKSTVAASLAFSYALAGRTTVLVECDFRRPSLAGRLGVKKGPGLIDYLQGRCEPSDIVQIVPDMPSGPSANGHAPETRRTFAPLTVIVAGEHPDGPSAELFETAVFTDFVAEISSAYDSVVIDTAPLLPVADTLEIVGRVDAVVLCVRASQTTRSQAAAGKTALEPVRDRLAGVAVTGVTMHDRGYYGYYGYYGYSSDGEGDS